MVFSFSHADYFPLSIRVSSQNPKIYQNQNRMLFAKSKSEKPANQKNRKKPHAKMRVADYFID
jgi:hypothetical protein